MISLQASDIFFCIRYDYLQDQNSAGSLFKELMFCTQYAFLPAFLRFVQNVWKANAAIFFLVYSAYMNFHLISPCMNFFCTSPAPHPHPPITFLMVRPQEAVANLDAGDFLYAVSGFGHFFIVSGVPPSV